MRTALDSFECRQFETKKCHNLTLLLINPLLREKKRTNKLAKEAKLTEKESNKCKVTAEKGLVLSIGSSANANFNQLIAHLSAKFANKTMQKRLKLRIKTLKKLIISLY
jgi:hypothetical protein